uniref:Ribokinase n=1 Tax=Heterorhabditis bacteriophora TaxID=37862 RepID=A0A1I7WXM3_HETBA
MTICEDFDGYLSYTPHFPRPGESVRGTSFIAAGGGKGANQAVAAARLGANVTLIGRVGNDMFGDVNIDRLRSNGVNVDKVEKSTTSTTATATITVNEQVVTLGANLEMDEYAAERHESEIVGAGLVLAQAEICPQGNRRIFEFARKYGIDIICTNENEIQHIEVEKVSAIDTTGAGDCFCGSLSVFILRGLPLSSAVHRAAAIATLSVQKKGAQSSYWTKEEIAKDYGHLLE